MKIILHWKKWLLTLDTFKKWELYNVDRQMEEHFTLYLKGNIYIILPYHAFKWKLRTLYVLLLQATNG